MTFQHRETTEPRVPVSSSSRQDSASLKPRSRAPSPGPQAVPARPGGATRAPLAGFGGAQREGSLYMEARDLGRQATNRGLVVMT